MFFPEVRERAVRIDLDNPGRHESRWQAIVSVAAKIGCSANRLNEWVEKAEVDGGKRAGVTTEMADRRKALEREIRRVFEANWRVCGVRKVCQQLGREGIDVARRNGQMRKRLQLARRRGHIRRRRGPRAT